MKKYFYKLACIFVLLMPCMHILAQKSGETCYTAIPMGKDYSASVKKGESIWYSAWTFDLPLSVYFAPKNGAADPAPIVRMDFTCTEGFYEDSILCSLFCKTGKTSGVDLQLPYEPNLKTNTLDDGTFVYYLSLGKQYRDWLLKMGINNVEVYVQVIYNSDGVISMAPDNLFSNCVDGAKFMHYGDTVQVAAQDKKRHVIVPYVQWQTDTILYKWTGTTPCILSVANTCDFNPTDNTDGNIIQFDEIQPGESDKVTALDMYKWVNNKAYPNEAGMYFAKVYSEAPGELQVVKVPQSPPRGKATLLRFDRTYALNANETALFAIPKSWDDDTLHIKFVTPTDHVFSMSVANDPDFSEEHTLKTYRFDKLVSGHWAGILGTEMVKLWKQTTEQYLYVRFDCSEATTVTPSAWEVSECYEETKNIIDVIDTTFVVKRASTGGYYRISYAQLQGGDLSATFSQNSKCQLFIATDCDISLSPEAANLLAYETMTGSQKTVTISAEEIADWAPRIGSEGYIYMRLHHTLSTRSTVTLTSSAPEETDPVYPAATISVKCDENRAMVVDVRADQQISVSDENGNGVDQWEAVIGNPYELNIETGTYLLQGLEEMVYILPMTLPKELLEAQAQPAGNTADKATRITGPAKLSVQSGGNYVRLDSENLPATVIYLPNTAFGPVPSLSIAGETKVSRAVFSDCYQGWAWQLPQSDKVQIAEVRAHENATVFVVPENTPVPECDDTDTTAVVTGSIDWYGKTYTESGDYSITKVTDDGCEYTHTLHLTVNTVPECDDTDTTAVVTGSIDWYGKTYTESGDYSITKVTADGCEYTHTLHLTVSSLPHVTETKQGCGTVEVDGTVYTVSTTLTDTVDIDGQQTVRTLVINVNHATVGELKIHECSAYTAPWGETYAQSGNYTYTTKNVAGCDSLVTLHLTIDDCDATYDTVYFCAGQNTEHDETVGLGRIMRYLPYVYESPAAWGGYMEGVIIQSELTRTLVDLNRAEQNLYEHYKDELTPVRSVSWSLRPDGQSEYRPVVVENVPQWVEAGVLAMTVRFLCGEMYTANFATDITNTGAVSIPCKVLENGQVIIIRGGKKYTVFGQRVD